MLRSLTVFFSKQFISMAGNYRIYIRFGKNHCIRLQARGDGRVDGDGRDLFEWVRDPDNLDSLRKGVRHVYEVRDRELGRFLDWKLSDDEKYAIRAMDEFQDGRRMLETFYQNRARFSLLRTGVQKLEAIASAADVMTVPRMAPRKRSDAPGWLYLIDLNAETLDVYEFKSYRTHDPRLTMERVQRACPDEPPGYHIHLDLSELQLFDAEGWQRLHQNHARALARLWTANAPVLRRVPHVDSLPFCAIYGSSFASPGGEGFGPPRRAISGDLKNTLTMMHNRKASTVSFRRIRPLGNRRATRFGSRSLT
ncbi:hypothetical protein GGR56DRAFT_634826 [Xylariaceae sp. FL0804]|nr:hypothetical protein GGR56DRAFT_634826 [Xylariaceae sp. FL0804]